MHLNLSCYHIQRVSFFLLQRSNAIASIRFVKWNENNTRILVVFWPVLMNPTQTKSTSNLFGRFMNDSCFVSSFVYIGRNGMVAIAWNWKRNWKIHDNNLIEATKTVHVDLCGMGELTKNGNINLNVWCTPIEFIISSDAHLNE